jgi:hypothetical protein
MLLPKMLASGPASLFQVRLVCPNLFSTSKPPTSKRVNPFRQNLCFTRTPEKQPGVFRPTSPPFPKTSPILLEQNPPCLWRKHCPTHFKKLPGWQARPNATISRAGAGYQNLRQSPNSWPSEASRQRRLHGVLGLLLFLNSNFQHLCPKRPPHLD